MQTDFLLWVFYTERRKNKKNMENFLNQIHEDLSQEVLPQREKRLREKKHKMSQMKILFVCLCGLTFPQGRLHREKKD
jgi:hypothetical protein